MPRPKLSTLDQPPYPTPSTSPTSPRSTPPFLKGPNAPPSPPTTKPRLGQSILGQLLAPHKGRDHYTLANDAALSLETIRPKEQRRSGLPASWAFGFSRTTTPTTPVPSSSTLNVTPLAISMANRKGRAIDPDQHYQTVLPSAWLEKILAGLSKSRTEVPPHYATLPKDGFPGSSTTSAPRSVMSLFDSKGKSPRLSKDSAKPSSSKLKRFSDLPIPSSPLAKPGTSPTPGALLHPGRPEAPHKMVRRSSVCELALGEEARELFQQNRPKTLSSAVISSTIVKQQKGSVPETKGLTSESATSTSSSSSTSSSTSSSSSTSLDNSEAPTVTESVSGTPPTTTITRGRFTIESSSPTPMASPMARTRTLSTASTSALPMAPVTSFSSSYLAPPTLTPGGTRPILDQPTISLSPASPLSFSLPSSSMNSVRPSSASRSFSVPSGSPPPSNGSTSSSSSSSCSNPISIPRATRSNHQRTHSNSSVQSSGSTSSSSRRSQVIIPPANTASFQFASFSSMASSSSGTGNGNVPPSSRPAAVKRANSSNNNNFRNLSIHVLGKDDDEEDAEVPPGPESDSSQVFHLESSVHPLDHPMMLSSRANTSPNLMHHHQTMHRVHPHSHVQVDSPSDSSGSSASMTRCGSFCCSSGRSSLNSLSSFGANEMPMSVEYGPACHAGYFRQRSLSTTHLDSSLYNNNNNNNSGSSPVPVPVPSASSYHHPQHLQPQRHSSSWSDRPGRRTHGSLSHEPSHLPHHLHQLHNRNSTPSLLSHGHGQLLDSSSPMSKASFGETSDVVMVKKSATGRMFTVERTIPVSPTRCSRFIVVSAEEEAAQAAAAAENGGGSRSHTPLSSTPTH